VAARSVPQALKELHALAAAGVEPLLIHGMLVRLFRTLALVKSYFEDETVRDKIGAADDLGLHPFVVKKTAPLTGRFSWDDIREVYRRLLALDLKLKRQGDDPYLPLELFIVNLETLTSSSH
jgi:DNA polymerase-3 subunit delta